MFKTSEQCQLELVAHTVLASPISLGGIPEKFHDHPVNAYAQEYADWLPVSAARASFSREDKTGEDEKADRKLMKFLADHRHVSCFEHNFATFLVECPMFVRSQIMRHKSFSFNEVSRRYTSEKIEFWIPAHVPDAAEVSLVWRKQAKSNKQCSTEETVPGNTSIFNQYGYTTYNQYGAATVSNQYFTITEACMRNYEELIKAGVCREQARAVLPQSLLTRFYMSGNLRSWWSFLSSRLKEDTQWETRLVAQRIEKKLREIWPESLNALLGEVNE